MTDHRTAEEAATALGARTGAGWTDRVPARRAQSPATDAPTAAAEPTRAPVDELAGTQPSSTRLGAAAISITSTVLMFIIVYVASVWTVAGQKIENAGMIAAEGFGESTQAIWSIVYNTVSYSTLVFGLAVLALFGLRSGGLRRALAAPSVLGVAIVAAELLKHVILPRPRLYPWPKWLGYPSYPSGHTTIAVGLAASALFVASGRTWRAVQIGGFLYAALMGISLIVTANHRLSDEVGSCLVVYLTAYLVSIVLRTGPRESIRHAVRAALRNVVAIVGMLFLVGVFAGPLAHHGRLTVAAGCVAYAVVCTATLRRVAALARGHSI
jgi:hypothetical protein